MAVPPDDVCVLMTAGIALHVFEIAAECWWGGDHTESRADILDGVSRDSRP
jgi:hypothetical protein